MTDPTNVTAEELRQSIERYERLAAERARVVALKAENARLRAVIDADPDDAAIASACLSYRHDFGLLDDKTMRGVIWDAREWWRAVQKEMRARAALTGEPQR